ncbi:isoprenylcysteine carboxylmethyltransferase family protein [Clostridium perfringens]|nr:isoprenylcysteine carboxylmethyltransferase family protein [Clostridium perfringens]
MHGNFSGIIEFFSSIVNYKLYAYSLDILFISEFFIWLFTSSKFSKNNKKQKTDRGSMWVVILGFCSSIYVSYFSREVSDLVLPNVFFYIGITLMILGVIIRDLAVITLKKSFTLSVQVTKDQHLIKTGLYKYVRNPAYTGSIMSLLGIALVFRSIFAPIAVIVICVFCYGYRINIEEKALRNQFKNEFDEYCKNTYKIFPFIW